MNALRPHLELLRRYWQRLWADPECPRCGCELWDDEIERGERICYDCQAVQFNSTRAFPFHYQRAA